MAFMFVHFLILAIIPTTLSYTVGTTIDKDNACQVLQQSNNNVCTFIRNGIDCLLAVQNKRADFCKVTAEEALVALPHLKNVEIVGEIRDEQTYNSDTEYQTIVIVRSDKINGINNLKGAKYCHPGNVFENLLITNYILYEFERKVLREKGFTNKLCDGKSDQYLEDYFKTLAEYFGQSCRPIQTADKNFNAYIEDKFPSLVASCEERNDFETALRCLVHKGGDIAVTTLNEYNNFFTQPENQNSKQYFKFLCKDGNTAADPCFWTKQPWELIVSERDKAFEIREYLTKELESQIMHLSNSPNQRRIPKPNDLLMEVLVKNTKAKLHIFDQITIENYMKKMGRPIPKSEDLDLCNNKRNNIMRWCTTSQDEQEKCNFLSTASINQGYTPIINCIKVENKLKCLEEIRNDKADVVNIDDYGYIAERYQLEGIVYTQNIMNTQPSIIVLLNNTLKNIKSLDDLKGKKACFPEYGGNEMLAFISSLKKTSTSCKYDEFILKFIGDSCIPGYDSFHEPTSKMKSDNEDLSDKYKKFCNLCKSSVQSPTNRNCRSTYDNEYYKNGTLRCLEQAGDYAVVNQHLFPLIEMRDYKVLCKDGTTVSFDDKLIPESCTLATITQSQIVTRKKNKSIKEYELLFNTFDETFVYNTPFEIFNEFNRTKELLFNDSTIGFAKLTNHYVNAYQDILKPIQECTDDEKDSSFSIAASAIILFLSFTSCLLFN